MNMGLGSKQNCKRSRSRSLGWRESQKSANSRPRYDVFEGTTPLPPLLAFPSSPPVAIPWAEMEGCLPPPPFSTHVPGLEFCSSRVVEVRGGNAFNQRGWDRDYHTGKLIEAALGRCRSAWPSGGLWEKVSNIPVDHVVPKSLRWAPSPWL